MPRADVAVRNANFLRYATTNSATYPIIDALTRMWTKFKAGG
jgi:hypothetical protein